MKAYLFSLFTFLALDAVWLGVIAKKPYDVWLKDFERTVRLGPILFFYPFLVLGIVLFVLPKADTLLQSFFWGALFGLVTYGTYDLTNYAVFKHWNVTMVIVDMLWGAFICGITSVAGYLVK